MLRTTCSSRKRHLPRRTFLRGMGATLALPMLDAMVPALSARAGGPVPRLGFIYVSNGVIQNHWKPATVGTGFELPPILKPLEPVRDQRERAQRAVAPAGGHVRRRHRRSPARVGRLADRRARLRSDQARRSKCAWRRRRISSPRGQIGKGTQVPSLELHVDAPTQGACDSGDCFYVNTISWRNPTTPNPAESHPRLVFERLFGDGGSAAQRGARVKETGSLLDSVTQEVRSLARTLGPGDINKLTEYLDSVREIEQRIQNAEAQGALSVELPDRPIGIPGIVRGTHQADAGSGGAGLSGRHHARLHDDLRPRAQQRGRSRTSACRSSTIPRRTTGTIPS